MNEYRSLEIRLRAARLRDNEEEEDRILDEMDAIWERLSEEEMELLNSEALEEE